MNNSDVKYFDLKATLQLLYILRFSKEKKIKFVMQFKVKTASVGLLALSLFVIISHFRIINGG